jgi:hypothetical protein
MHLVPRAEEFGDEVWAGEAGDPCGQNPHGARRYTAYEGCVKALADGSARNYPGRMIRIPRPWRGLVCAATLALGLCIGGSGVASASPSDVIADFSIDGAVDGQIDKDPEIDLRHSYNDLVYAKSLMAIQQPARYPEFVASDDLAIKRLLLGQEDPGSATPSGPPTVPVVDMPNWAIAVAIGAAVLLLAGILSALFLRTRRRLA